MNDMLDAAHGPNRCYPDAVLPYSTAIPPLGVEQSRSRNTLIDATPTVTPWQLDL